MKNEFYLYVWPEEKHFSWTPRVGTIHHSTFSYGKDASEFRQTEAEVLLSTGSQIGMICAIHFPHHPRQVQFCFVRRELLSLVDVLFNWFWVPQVTGGPDCWSVPVALLAAHLEEIVTPDASLHPTVQNLYLCLNSTIGLGETEVLFLFKKQNKILKQLSLKWTLLLNYAFLCIVPVQVLSISKIHLLLIENNT